MSKDTRDGEGKEEDSSLYEKRERGDAKEERVIRSNVSTNMHGGAHKDLDNMQM